MNSRPAPLELPRRRQSYIRPIALMVVVPLLCALALWLLHLPR